MSTILRQTSGSKILVLKNAACLLLLVALASCSSHKYSRLTNQWHEYSYKGPAFEKVLVIVDARNEATKSLAEDLLVASLRDKGLNSAPGYAIFEDDVEIDDEKIASVAEAYDFDAVLKVKLVERSFTQSYAVGYGSQTLNDQVYDIGKFEAAVHTAQDMNIIWYGSTEYFKLKYLHRNAPKLVNSIAKAMDNENLVFLKDFDDKRRSRHTRWRSRYR